MNRIGHRRLGSVGKPIPGVKVRIDSETKELQIKGSNVMKGYYNNPELTKTVITDDGWLKTGDIAKISSHGYIYITGRLKNMIVLSGGKKVFPEEVEAVLTKSDLIEEIVVYSDIKKTGAKQGTEEIVAKIYPGKNAVEKHSKEELTELVRQEVKRLSLELSSYKRPTNIDVSLEPLPRTGISKISRKFSSLSNGIFFYDMQMANSQICLQDTNTFQMTFFYLFSTILLIGLAFLLWEAFKKRN